MSVGKRVYPSDGSEKIDAQVRRSNSDMIPDSEVEGHIAKTGGNDIIQSFNLPNHLVDAKTEHLDCNTNLLIEGTDGIPAAVTGVHAKDDELDHVLLHVRTHMLLSSMKSGTTDSICSSDSSKRIVNTDCRPSRSGVSGQLISLKTETMEEVYTDDVSEANRGLEFGAHGLGPLEKHVIGISGTTALSSSEVRMCPEVNLLKTNKFQTDQMICNCSRDANTLDPQLLALGQSLEDQNNGNDVLDSVLPSISSEVKVEPLEEICTHNGLGTTAQKPVSSSLEATSRKPTWSSGSGYSAKTKKHIEYSLTDKHCQDMLASDS
ncbi:hypothetical protein B296_00052774 [Ensete ventricosum]|uniref:Uncharacterized protein n=1 Tax=Ensete ventricosum TaxID=4639 RepID=A0A426YAV6_ENSVE|nr:hypothetical protein B296_00052774 [Ensete ventricosum]